MKIGMQAWGSEGDIRPFTALAAGLVSSGHEVTLTVTDNEGRDYSSLARRYGFLLKSVPLPMTVHPEEAALIWQRIISVGNPIKQAEMIMTYGFDPVMEDMYAAACDLCVGKDLVIGHFFVFPLRVAASKAIVPIATVNIVHNCIPSAYTSPPGLPDFGKWFYPLGWKLVRKMINRIFLPRVNALRIREGLSPDKDVMEETWSAERLNMIAVSPRICEPRRDWSSRHQVCGFLNLPEEDDIIEPLPEGLDTFLAAGSAPIYITFGSMMPQNLNYIQETILLWTKAIKQVGCRAIVQIPWDDLSLFETDSQIFKLKRSPYRIVFPRCSAIVHHGGSGTTQSSLLAGKPSVVVAHMADQFFWGAELKRLGVAGKTLLRKSLSEKKLAREIAYVLSQTTMNETAISIGKTIGKENGVRNAVSLIEKTFSKLSET
jgi:sterol 3beta-glucosyltransferase